MKLSELMGEKAGRLADVEITGVTCDSRHVGPGNAFVCIRGTAADGHKFAEAAVQQALQPLSAKRTWGLTVRCL